MITLHTSKAFAILAISAIVAGCTTAPTNTAQNEKVKLCISQITSHQVFDDIVTGIKNVFDGSDLEVVYDLQNAQGDTSVNQSIAQKFANEDCTVLMPLGTQSSQAIVHLVKDKPIIFGAVTDPLSAGLVTSLENPGANVTGTSDITLYREHLELLKQLVPAAKKIGIVYNPGEANARFGLEQTQKIADEMELELVTAPANNGSEVQSAARSIVSKVDAFYLLPDNTVLAAQDALIGVAIEAKKPFISLDQSGVEKGALATLGTSYIKVGERTAEIAMRVLAGEKPSSIPVLGVTDADLFINETTAQKIGVTFSSEQLQSAKQIYR